MKKTKPDTLFSENTEILDEEKVRSLKYSTKDTGPNGLIGVCEQYGLDYQNFGTDEKLVQLLHEYRVVAASAEILTFQRERKIPVNDSVKQYAKEKLGLTDDKSIAQTVHKVYEHLSKTTMAAPEAETQMETQQDVIEIVGNTKGKVKHPAYSLEYNLMLGFIYIAARNSGNPLFLIDVIEAAGNNSLPYFTGYSQYSKDHKSLSKGYAMVPTNLPTTEYLRKVVTKLVENGDCHFEPYPAHECFTKVKTELGMPRVVIDIAEYFHKKLGDRKAKKKDAKISDEAWILGGIVFVLKLIYGLDDKPYIRHLDPVLKDALSEDIYRKLQTAHEVYEKHDKSLLGGVTSMMPSLYEFAKSLRAAITAKRSSLPWKIADLHWLSMEQVNRYLDHAETVVFAQTGSDPAAAEYSHVYSSLADIFRELDPPKDSEPVPVAIIGAREEKEKGKEMNEYVTEELEFAENVAKIAEKEPEKKIAFPHPAESYLRYKQVFSDLSKDPLSYEYQYVLTLFGKYLGEPINQLVRAVKGYEDLLLIP